MPVVVEPQASHKQVCAIKRGEYMSVVAKPFARETQDFALVSQEKINS